jgi:hypothetical protein
MKRSDIKKANDVMNQLGKIQASGNHDFSNIIGVDDSYAEMNGDNYEDDNYEDDYFAKKRGGGSARRANVNPPQTDIRLSLTNQIGVSGSSSKSGATTTSVVAVLFGATKNSLGLFPALGLTQNNLTLGSTIDGVFTAGTASATDRDLVLSSDTSSYSQIFSDTRTSPMVAKGLRLQNSNATQLATSFTIGTVDSLGNTQNSPYTAASKQSAYQFSSTIIEDKNFNVLLDGNKSINYTIYSPGQGGTTASVGNTQSFTLYMFKQADVGMALKGKNPMQQAPQFQFPSQTLRIGK